MSEEQILARRRERREGERRRRAEIRRRRLLLLAGLVGVVAVVVVVVSAMAGGGSSGDGATGVKSGEGKAGHGSQSAAKPGVPINGQPSAPSKAPVPILMYHVIAPSAGNSPYPDLFVKPVDFAAQIKWLASNGYSAVTLNQVYDAWFKNGTLPKKPVVLSFDDGYLGQYVFARRDLVKLNWPGVLNLKVNALDPGGELTDAKVKAMISDGWELDAHTIHHLDVSQLTGAPLKLEVAGSRQILQRRFGVPVNFFCYPSGRYNATAIQAVKAAGYLGATTTNHLLASPNQIYTLNRIRVSSSDGVSGLAKKLANPASAGGGPA